MNWNDVYNVRIKLENVPVTVIPHKVAIEFSQFKVGLFAPYTMVRKYACKDNLLTATLDTTVDQTRLFIEKRSNSEIYVISLTNDLQNWIDTLGDLSQVSMVDWYNQDNLSEGYTPTNAFYKGLALY